MQRSAKNNSMTLLKTVKGKGVILGFATQFLVSTFNIQQARQITTHLSVLPYY